MNLKEVKQRILSIKSTQKITSAMKLVSAAKLRKAQAAVESMLPYKNKLHQILSDFLSEEKSLESLYAEQRAVGRVAIFVVSSNNSLCGAFNANVIRQLKAMVEEYRPLGMENILIYPVGRKVAEAVRKMKLVVPQDLDLLAAKPDYHRAAEVARELMRLFKEKKIDKAELLYNHFKSSASQQLTRTLFLPVTWEKSGKREGEMMTDYIVEPSPSAIVQSLLPKVLCMELFTAVIDSAAAEQAARVTAMQIATDNADEMITSLTREYNKGRQQAITNELLDLAGGGTQQ